MLVGRWGLYTNPTGAPGESLKWQDVRLVDDIDTEPSEEGSVRVFERALPATVKALREAGHEVLLLGQVPPFGTKPNTCLETHLGGMRNWVKSKIPDDCKRSRESIDARLERSNQIIRRAGNAG